MHPLHLGENPPLRPPPFTSSPSLLSDPDQDKSQNAINEHFLPRFLDFIVWGHEHECLVDPQVILKDEADIDPNDQSSVLEHLDKVVWIFLSHFH
ncbi:double-strand break repair protein MRE11-like [Magnolia sinica]|uniref:double-strand break repair protein MRE11-like n=1 Tax=Magnolia sinica TaxID=86752 RepID=UPI00265A6BA9|nr:double-strand break repair protein MRE11-like [Magnolia sinica]